MYFPVVNAQTQSVRWLDLSDVFFIGSVGDKLIIRARDGDYIPVTTIRDFADVLSVFGFEMLDKSNVVNMRRITKYDKQNKEVYFDGEIAGEGAHVSRRNVWKLGSK